MSPFDPNFLVREPSFPRELGLMPCSKVALVSVTFLSEFFLIKEPLISLELELSFSTSEAKVSRKPKIAVVRAAYWTSLSFFYSLVILFNSSATFWNTFITNAELLSFIWSPCFFHLRLYLVIKTVH